MSSVQHSQDPATCRCPKPDNSLFQRICPGSRIFLTICNVLSLYGEQLLALRPNHNLEAHHFRLYATSFSASGSRPVHPKPEDAPCLCGRDSLNHELKNLNAKTCKYKNVFVIVHECETFYLSFGEKSWEQGVKENILTWEKGIARGEESTAPTRSFLTVILLQSLLRLFSQREWFGQDAWHWWKKLNMCRLF